MPLVENAMKTDKILIPFSEKQSIIFLFSIVIIGSDNRFRSRGFRAKKL